MKILIIENNSQLSENMQKSFESHGHDSDVFSRTGEAYVKLRDKNDYNLIILDLEVMEGDIDGVLFCKKIRNDGVKTPVLFIEKNENISDAMKVIDSGANDYIAKPFSLAELVNKAESMMGAGVKNNSIEKNDILGESPPDDKEIHLTSKEEAIWKYFKDNPDQVLSRQMILENVWPFDSKATSNIVDVHVKNLRKKISAKKNVGTLETVWGEGYRWRKTRS